MSVLLMGVNRAYPYAKLEMDKVSEHIDTMYRVVHAASFNVSVHTLALLYQVSDYSNNVNDRWVHFNMLVFFFTMHTNIKQPLLYTQTPFKFLHASDINFGWSYRCIVHIEIAQKRGKLTKNVVSGAY